MEKRIRLTEKLAAETEKKKPKPKATGELIRNLDGFEYDPSKAKILKKALHNLNVSLGSMIGAMRDLALLRGSEITPDGMLGGRGFIMSFKEMKAMVNEAITNLSDVTDSIGDELTNPRWGLSSGEKEKVQEEKENLEEKVEEIEEVVGEKGTEGPAPEITPPAAPVIEVSDIQKPAESLDIEELNPSDIRNSADVEAIKRYQDVLVGKAADKTASILSKDIMANLLKGE